MIPGFGDPVLDSHACFRAVLDAMARPGTLHHAAAPAPPGLDPAAAAVLLTLVDIETPVWIEDEAAADWVAFHCGAGLTGAAEAAFAVTRGGLDLTMFCAGSDEGPEDGATVLVQVTALGATTPTLSHEREQPLVLRGPGIEHEAALAVVGLPDDFRAQWAANRALFPRGVDLVLCAGTMIAALPRTVEIT